MSAKRESNVNPNRSRLEEVLPLETPYSLFIDPCNLCNFKCQFCAVQTSSKDLNYKKGFMPMELYKKIIDDIQEFPDKLRMLRVAQHGEPLLHPELPEMIRYAKEKEVSDFIEIVTNGSKLNPQLNTELVESGLDRIRISIEAVSAEGYQKIAGTKVDFEQMRSNIKDIYEKSVRRGGTLEVYIKTVDAAVDTKEKEKMFYQMFEDRCHKIFIEHIVPIWSDWEELSGRFDLQQSIYGQKVQPVQVCPFPFYSFTIAPDGIATVCCSDWERKLAVGDLNKQSLREVWNGEVLKKFWMDMLSGNKGKYEMCEGCLYPMYNCTDNIDAYAPEILSRMQ